MTEPIFQYGQNPGNTNARGATRGFYCEVVNADDFSCQELSGEARIHQSQPGQPFRYNWQAHGKFAGMDGEPFRVQLPAAPAPWPGST